VLKNLYLNIKYYIENLNLKKDRRPVIFLICLFLATALWFANALGKKYETNVSMPVQYTGLPTNKALVKAPLSSISVKMEAYGYTLLRHKINLTINPINFNFNAFTNNLTLSEGTSNIKIATNQYIPQISKQISSEITITEISPDTLTFSFDDIISKKIIVKGNLNLSFENQYFLLDSVRFTPDSIEITGPESMVDTITSISTKHEKFKDLNTNVVQNISLENIPGVEVATKRVELNIPVSLYTEYTDKIKIQRLNVPDSLNLVTFPGYVNISCIIAFENYANIDAAGFILAVDYKKITPDRKTLPVEIIKKPTTVKSLTVSPKNVEFIIENKND
jgi:YbbR domain-containing protein